MTPEPQRGFGRPTRQGRTLTPRGVGALIVAALLALACARLFGATPPF